MAGSFNPFDGLPYPPNSPQVDGFAVAAGSDSIIYSPALRGFWVGSTGNAKVDMAGGQTVTFNAIPSGTFIPAAVTKIYLTGSTATNMVGLR